MSQQKPCQKQSEGKYWELRNVLVDRLMSTNRRCMSILETTLDQRGFRQKWRERSHSLQPTNF